MNTLGPRKMWTRSEEGWLAGVCQGLGESFDINPGMLRLLWIASVMFFGFGIFLYFVCAFCFPIANQMSTKEDNFVLGVCRRIAERVELETAIVRVVAIFLLFGSFGTVSLIYILLHFILPNKSTEHLV